MLRTRAHTPLTAALIAAVAATAAITACSGASSAPQAASPSALLSPATATATAAASATATGLAERALAAYTAMWGDVQAAGETSNYQDPRLAAHLDGQALLTTSQNMAVDKANGIIGLGQPELSDTTVLTSTATVVTLRGCMSDEHWLKYFAATHKLVDTVPGGRRYVAATVTDENGTWKVTTLDVRGEATCD